MSDSGKKGKRLKYNSYVEMGQFGYWKKQQKPNQHLLLKELESTITCGSCEVIDANSPDPGNKIPNTGKKVNNPDNLFV